MGFNPSYAWKSIWGSRSILERGVRWKVSDGKSIKLWHDAWLGKNGTGKLITPARVLDKEATVESILDNKTHQWRREMLSDIFLPIVVDCILQVPIAAVVAPDERVWVGSIYGIFKVRDVYSMALRFQTEDSSSDGDDPIWKLIWSLQIHPKAQIFLWRVMWDILPHGSNMCKKGIDNVGQCTRCGMLENNTHVLRECKWSKEVWEQYSPSIDLPRHEVTMREWFGMMINRSSKTEVEL